MLTQIKVPDKAKARIVSAVKRFQPIISSALDKDINESDTSLIVADMLADLFGYEKFSEITSEHQIKSTYCDLALTVEGKLKYLVEVKAIGLTLKDNHLRQAVNYAANQGVEWTILTNAAKWQVYKVNFGKPIQEEIVLEFDMLKVDPKNPTDISMLYSISREGIKKGILFDYYTRKQAANKYILGAIISSEPVVKVIRRELKRISPDIKVSTEQIKNTVESEVLKRDVVDSEEGRGAKKKVHKLSVKASKIKANSESKANGDLINNSAEDEPNSSGNIIHGGPEQ